MNEETIYAVRNLGRVECARRLMGEVTGMNEAALEIYKRLDSLAIDYREELDTVLDRQETK